MATVIWVCLSVCISLVLIWALDRLDAIDRLGRLIARIARWWSGRRDRFEECEVCGKRDRRNVTVSSTPTHRGALGGWSAISATWCREHVPEEHRPAA